MSALLELLEHLFKCPEDPNQAWMIMHIYVFASNRLLFKGSTADQDTNAFVEISKDIVTKLGNADSPDYMCHHHYHLPQITTVCN